MHIPITITPMTAPLPKPTSNESTNPGGAMSGATPERGRECVLILTPIGRDSEYARSVLSRAGIAAQVCSDLAGLCELVTDEIGVVLIAEEALTNRDAPHLIARLNEQPPWSDIPIVIFTSGGETSEASARVMRLFENSGNVTLLERPVRTLTLISAVHVALRARRRQWEIRELLEQREHLLREARSAREEAVNANRTKDQFLATLSHELRTPLNAILGWTQLLLDEAVSKEDVQLGVQTIDRNARTQAQLIEDLLDVSRIVSGKLRLDKQKVDPIDVLGTAVDSVAQAAAARGVTLVFEPHMRPRKATAERPALLADPARLQQIAWNLLSNAVKFTPKGGQIKVETEWIPDNGTPSQLSIRVSDNGIGIDPAFLPYVFDRFRQADGSSTRRQGGLGLGLSIVKQLVELHGGSIQVESEGIGKGATFTALLPANTVSEHSATPSADAPTAAQSDGSATKDGAAGRRALAGMKVLIIDDEADAREVLRRLLNDQKAMVHVAESVTHALALIQETKPDVIVTDISMPDSDGFDLLRAIRTDGHGAKEVPVIALTAYASDEDRARILSAGFTAHVPKPLDQSVLLATLRKL